ncbi:MAG: Portal protein [uncultured bacterium]|nr:MAG: Portal protein [uncultured bacterium]
MPYKFEYHKEDKPKNLSQESQDKLASYISDRWDKWDDLRRPNLEIIDAVEKAIYPSRKSSANKIDITMPEIYETKETYKAHLWKSWFSTLDTMFDVQGKSRDDHYKASQQKAALVDVFREINLVSKLEIGLDNWVTKGEFIAFINWKTKVKQVRRKELCPDYENFETEPATQPASIENGFSENSQAQVDVDSAQYKTPKLVSDFVLKDEVVYDGPDFTIVTPEAFVFDSTKKDNFDACPKIYRSWATYDEIASNKLYQNHDELKNLCEENKDNSDNKALKGDQIEILEYWGNIKLNDGTLLENWVITVAGRKAVVRFEPNPFVLNPFVFAAFLEDPKTKRGISPLYVALPLNEASTTILNLQLDALKLIINKPYLAPKGSLSGKINIKEGAIIEYDPALMPKEPIPLDFKDALVGWDFLRFFEEKIESATGVFKYLTGDTNGLANRTATEATGLMQAQGMRISKEIDVLNFRVKVPIIQKIAELMSNFSFDIKEIKITKHNGDVDFVVIDETVRQGRYEYVIGDTTAISERKSKLRENLEILHEFAKHPEIAPKIRWVEVMKWAFEQLGSADPNMFIREDIGF